MEKRLHQSRTQKVLSRAKFEKYGSVNTKDDDKM